MIYLVRQGQTDWNLLKKFNGLTETQLNETGRTQVRQLAEKLQRISFDACFSSTQLRAQETCAILGYKQPILDERLTEINCGDFEGMEENAESMALFWRAVMNGDRGTENYKEFISRNCAFCDWIMANYYKKDVLIVTHAANARVLNYYFTGKPKSYDFMKPIGRSGDAVLLDFPKSPLL